MAAAQQNGPHVSEFKTVELAPEAKAPAARKPRGKVEIVKQKRLVPTPITIDEPTDRLTGAGEL